MLRPLLPWRRGRGTSLHPLHAGTSPFLLSPLPLPPILVTDHAAKDPGHSQPCSSSPLSPDPPRVVSPCPRLAQAQRWSELHHSPACHPGVWESQVPSASSALLVSHAGTLSQGGFTKCPAPSALTVPHPSAAEVAADSKCQRSPQRRGAQGMKVPQYRQPSLPASSDPWHKQGDIVPISEDSPSAWWTNSDLQERRSQAFTWDPLPCSAKAEDRFPPNILTLHCPCWDREQRDHARRTCPKPAPLQAALTFPYVLPAPRITAPVGAQDRPSRNSARRRRWIRCSRRAPAPWPRCRGWEPDGAAAMSAGSVPELSTDGARGCSASTCLSSP